MTIDEQLRALRDIVQVDVGNRGLARDPNDNLFTACPDDFANACRSIAEHPHPRVGIVTGFMIPSVDPPMGETDGPLGAIFLARAFAKLGIDTLLISDNSALNALHSYVSIRSELRPIEVLRLPPGDPHQSANDYRKVLFGEQDPLTHLISVERVGISHSAMSVALQCDGDFWEIPEYTKLVPEAKHSRCYTMRGRDITDLTMPAHQLFAPPCSYTTIGIGDGGNEIGMGNIPWHIIDRNIPNGALIACSVPTDHLIVAGISNWGAYALVAGVMLLRKKIDLSFFDEKLELELLERLVREGPLVDGVTGQRTATVDGHSFEEYSKPLLQIRELLASLAESRGN